MTASYLAGARINAPEQKFNLTIKPEEWTKDALCQEMPPDLWFPDAKGARSPEDVVAICGRCPVAGACLEYALRTGQTEGIWAGQSPRQLKRLRAVARR